MSLSPQDEPADFRVLKRAASIPATPALLSQRLLRHEQKGLIAVKLD